jgi:DNA-directed RNA polymerase
MANRGRIYCNVDYLNNQSTDLAKALLLSARLNKIYKTDDDAINYLKIYGVNCFGNKLDKKSFENRIKWVDQN